MDANEEGQHSRSFAVRNSPEKFFASRDELARLQCEFLGLRSELDVGRWAFALIFQTSRIQNLVSRCQRSRLVSMHRCCIGAAFEIRLAERLASSWPAFLAPIHRKAVAHDHRLDARIAQHRVSRRPTA